MGPVTTLQYVNNTIGTFTNIIQFKENKGKTKGFQVVVAGKPVNDTRIDLTFKRIIIDRERSRVGLNRIVIPIPPLPDFSVLRRIVQRFIKFVQIFVRRFLPKRKEKNTRTTGSNENTESNGINGSSSNGSSSNESKEDNDSNGRGPYFNMLYLDEEMRIHKTGDNNYFVQTRLYDAWNPMVGWTLITAT